MSSAIGPQPHPVYGFPADSLRPYADAASPADVHHPHMRRSTYAVWWTEGQGPRHAGKLELGRLHALLAGNGGGRIALPLDEIVSIDYAHGELRLARREAATLRIGSLDAPGALLELTDLLRQFARSSRFSAV